MFNVLVLGSGGREHAMTWALSKDEKVNKIFCAPGNAGTSKISTNIPLNIMNNNEILDFVKSSNIDLVVVGPEQPLENGVVDFFKKHNKKIFGPNKFASQLETSKLFARFIMEEYNIPQPAFFDCKTEEEIMLVSNQLGYPLVLKADGLAGGKGVIICNDNNELDKAIDVLLINKKFGSASSKISVEEYLYGEEVSVFAICDGENYKIINSAQDHKRAYDDDKGPNTGGMGAYSPAPIFNKNLQTKTENKILKPILKAMVEKGHPYQGFLYLGLMIVDGDPFVIEYNVRLGDPEAQVILPLMKTSLFELIMSVENNQLNEMNIENHNKYAVTVVLAAKGYPGKYNLGMQIKGLDKMQDEMIFHAGTRMIDNHYFTNGGRILNVLGIDSSLESAISKSYDIINLIDYDEKYFRTDIGKKAVSSFRTKG